MRIPGYLIGIVLAGVTICSAVCQEREFHDEHLTFISTGPSGQSRVKPLTVKADERELDGKKYNVGYLRYWKTLKSYRETQALVPDAQPMPQWFYLRGTVLEKLGDQACLVKGGPMVLSGAGAYARHIDSKAGLPKIITETWPDGFAMVTIIPLGKHAPAAPATQGGELRSYLFMRSTTNATAGHYSDVDSFQVIAERPFILLSHPDSSGRVGCYAMHVGTQNHPKHGVLQVYDCGQRLGR